eukprot:6178114-Pleurochrysis_carterae.AAC.1
MLVTGLDTEQTYLNFSEPSQPELQPVPGISQFKRLRSSRSPMLFQPGTVGGNGFIQSSLCHARTPTVEKVFDLAKDELGGFWFCFIN